MVSTQNHDLHPTLSRNLGSCSISDEVNHSDGASDDEQKKTSHSIDVACNLVQRLLVQLTLNDSPPTNDDNNNYIDIEETSQHSSQSPSLTQPLSDIERTMIQTSLTNSCSQYVTTNQCNKCQDSSRLQQQGHVALVDLCTRSLERLGKQPDQTFQLHYPLSKRQKEDSLSRKNLDSEDKSQSFKWMKKKWKYNSPRSSSSRSLDSDFREGRDAFESHNVDCPKPVVRLQMFGSEYARFLSTTSLAPKYDSVQTSKRTFLRRTMKHTIQNIEDTDSSVLTGPITDIITTHGVEKPPKGYYRVSQSPSGEPFFIRDRKSTMFLCVKKETNWDRAAQRPCVTAISLIFPDRKEFVPPGFSLVRLQRSLPSTSVPTRSPANLNIGGSEPVYLCFRRSREGNPLTGILPLFPSKHESVPEGYTVLERSPRNFVASFVTSLRASGTPIFLAYRQRLANLESLRPFPLVMSVLKGESNTAGLKSYYCTGGTVVDNSRVGRFHIMDRSTHSLLSPSSIKNRLTLIESSRRKSSSSIKDHSNVTGEKYSYSSTTSVQSSSSSQKFLSSSLMLMQEIGTLESRTTMSDSDRYSSTAGDFESVTSSSEVSRSFTSPSQHNDSTVYINDNKELGRCLETLSFIPTVSHAFHENNSKGVDEFQMRVAILIPVLTSCYTRHGGSALVAVEGLTDLLRQDFYVDDIDMSQNPSAQTTLLDLSIQVVCDVATVGAQETQLYACVEFVELAIKYGCGYFSARTVGYVLRFYLFVFYFGISSPTGNWGITKASDQYLLEDTRFTVERFNLPGGAPQSAILSLKDLIVFMVARLGSQIHLDQCSLMREAADSNSKNTSHCHFITTNELVNEVVDKSVLRVDMANFTELAMHQIMRSGGSELFWYEMINLCGSGLFGNDLLLREETRHMYAICFALLANCVKVASSKVRKNKKSEGFPRDVANKLMALEMLKFFLVTWEGGIDSQEVPGSHSVESFTFCIRRLVVPCLLSNTPEALDDPRIFRRLIQVVGVLWCSLFYRKHMKLELGILFNHFVLRLLKLGPQILFRSNDDTNKTYVFAQQLELMKEIMNWFSGDTDRLLELYLNFDTDYGTQQVGGAKELLPGVQWKLSEQLCSLLCNLSENCTEFLGDKIRESQSTSPANKSVQDEGKTNKGYDGVSTVTLARESATRLRQAALDTIAQIVKLLARGTAISLGPKFSSIMEAWYNGRKFGKGRSERIRNEEDNSRSDAALVVEYWQKLVVTKRRMVVERDSIRYSGYKKRDDLNAGASEIKNNLNVAFNISREKGLIKAIDYLIACNVLTASPRDISSFLRIHCEDLNPSDLGSYLGEGGVDISETNFWNLIRFNYIRAISFVGMTVEEGLRHLLTQGGFRLPGEAQQIDRLISTFARCYWEDNAGDLTNCPIEDEDTIFVLSFAIIMLNTDLHKSNYVTKGKKKFQIKKMSKDEFINNLRGVNKGNEIDRGYLSNIYDGIEANPIILQYIDDKDNSDDFLKDNLETCIIQMNDNVKSLDALLRGLAIHEYRFISLHDYSTAELDGSIEGATINLSRNFVVKNWHQFHGLINSALKIAHLDPKGMESCIDLLKFALGLTILLDMPIEQVAFLDQLGRFRLFNAWRNRNSTMAEQSLISFQDQDSYKKEKWYEQMMQNMLCNNESNDISINGKFESMVLLDEVVNELGFTLAFDAAGRKKIREATRQFENAEFLLNDPTRCFLREGNILKRTNRSGRDVEYRFFLFSDVLIYAKKNPRSSPTKYRIHEELPLILMKVVDWFAPELRKDESKRAIQIYHPRKKFLVLCSTSEERKSWVADIREAINKELERKVAFEIARKVAANVPTDVSSSTSQQQ